MDTLDKHIRAHYEATSLEKDQLHRIMNSGSAERRVFRVLSGAIAAGVLLLASLAVHHQTSIGERADRTLREAALNHSTRLDLEFTSDQINTLNQQMALLPFTISLPASLDSSYKIVGTRYCTINGKLAAHVKLLDSSSSNAVSIFMTNVDEDLEHLDNKQRMIDGLDVRLWRERGLFYAMAQTTS